MNYNYLATIYESIFAQMYKFLLEKYIFPILAYKFFMVKSKTVNYTRNTYIWVNFIYCSWITVVHVHVNIFIYISPSMPQYCKLNKETASNLKTTDKHAAECLKAYDVA